MNDVIRLCIGKFSIQSARNHGREYKKYVSSDSTLLLTFKKLSFVEFWCSKNEKYLQLFAKTTEALLFSFLCEAKFVLATWSDISKNLRAEADMRT